jgi:hypothetical protein
MAVNAFKFSSPGIFLNEVDQSQIPQAPAPVGPIIIGRAQRGPAMRPVTVSSFDEFVATFGEPVAGGDTADVWRSGTPAGPTYGGYAAQAWLANNPTVTYVRLLGVQSSTATSTTSNNSGYAGWTYGVNTDNTKAVGAYGLYVFPPAPGTTASLTDATTHAVAVDGATMFVLNVPTSVGGQGSNITFIVKQSNDVSATTPAATEVFVAGGSPAIGGSTTATNFIAAINSGSATGVKYGSGVTLVSGGIAGMSASAGSGATKVTLHAYYPGVGGNSIALTNAGSGTTLAGSALVGGTGVNINTNSFNITGSLAAIWYCSGSVPVLSGTAVEATTTSAQNSRFILSDSNGVFTVKMSSSSGLNAGVGGSNSIKQFNFDPSSNKFIRKVFNTNPQNVNQDLNTGLDPSGSSYYAYWLGETFENDIVNNVYVTGALYTGDQKAGIIVSLKELNDRLGDEAEEDTAARTGWIIGQVAQGQESYNPANAPKLFRFISLDGGDWIRNNLKITINNIQAPQNDAQKYGTFDVEIRRIYDTDANKKLVESYTGCDLDPSSPNYIARRIGDVSYTWDDTQRRLNQTGLYPNNSKFVRVEMYSDSLDSSLVPFGVLGPLKYTDLSGNLATVAAGGSIIQNFANAYASASAPVTSPISMNYKFIFPSARQRVTSAEDSLTTFTLADFGATTTRAASSILYNEGINDLLRLPATGSSEFVNGVASTSLQYAWAFSLDEVVKSGTGASTLYTYTSGSKTNGTSFTATGSGGGTYADLLNNGVNSFTTVFQGGTDGFNIIEGEPLRNTAMSSSPTNDSNYIYYTYRRAIDTVRDPEEVQGNVLVIPGLSLESLTSYELQIAEQRGDVLAIIDASGDTNAQSSYVTKYEVSDYRQGTNDRVTTVDQAVAQIKSRNLNSSYGATYYPWVQISDSTTGKIIPIPPSIVALGAMSYTDSVQAPWFAPAGFNRGGLSTGNAGVNVVNVVKKLSQSDRDKLYPVNINPITSFPNEGIVIFGQKTLQATPSALDRINVRRLMIYIKRGINLISTSILFEPNVEATWNNFKDQAEPFLADVKARFGLTDYKLILDSTTTTPDLIDQNILYAKIFLKPARAIEFIAIDFFITRSGAEFPV